MNANGRKRALSVGHAKGLKNIELPHCRETIGRSQLRADWFAKRENLPAHFRERIPKTMPLVASEKLNRFREAMNARAYRLCVLSPQIMTSRRERTKKRRKEKKKKRKKDEWLYQLRGRFEASFFRDTSGRVSVGACKIVQNARARSQVPRERTFA